MNEPRTYIFRLDGEDELEIHLDTVQSVSLLERADDLRAIMGFCHGLLLSYGEDVDFKALRKLARMLLESGITRWGEPS